MSALLSVEIAGLEHGPVETAIYAVGWLLGWLLLWRPRHLTSDIDSDIDSTHDRPSVAVIIPARDEAPSLPHLLRPLMAQRREGDQILVVDDHSSDETADVARGFGADVVTPPRPVDGWLGKTNACWHGASSMGHPVLVFLDADVRPGPTLLDDLASAVLDEPDVLVSMQPWHRMETVGEQPSILFNITALMGCGAFTPAPRLTAANVAFGPVIAVSRATYDRVGGHAAPTVRGMHTEDIALARAVGRSHLAVGSPTTTTFRMYPDGFPALVQGWTRSIATGARSIRWWIGVAVALWMCSVAGGWLAVPLVYPLTAIQVWVLGRRAGTIHPVAAALFPLLVVVFVAVFVRSAFAIVLGRDVTWKGRRVGTRSG